jgi:Domain of unknown function (DUF4148)
MFKSLVPAMFIVSVFVAPAVAFAQTDAPLTRAQVKEELAQLGAAGYHPAASQLDYPLNMQAAQARVDAQNAQSGYGGVPSRSSASGAPVHSTSGDNL